jgi:uncharacterized membrane protein
MGQIADVNKLVLIGKKITLFLLVGFFMTSCDMGKYYFKKRVKIGTAENKSTEKKLTKADYYTEKRANLNRNR